jgi:hypothetical protein
MNKNQDFFKQKYLKYKSKYIEQKSGMPGRNVPPPPIDPSVLGIAINQFFTDAKLKLVIHGPQNWTPDDALRVMMIATRSNRDMLSREYSSYDELINSAWLVELVEEPAPLRGIHMTEEDYNTMELFHKLTNTPFITWWPTPLRHSFAFRKFMEALGLNSQRGYLETRSWFMHNPALQKMLLEVVLQGYGPRIDVLTGDFREHMLHFLDQIHRSKGDQFTTKELVRPIQRFLSKSGFKIRIRGENIWTQDDFILVVMIALRSETDVLSGDYGSFREFMEHVKKLKIVDVPVPIRGRLFSDEDFDMMQTMYAARNIPFKTDSLRRSLHMYQFLELMDSLGAPKRENYLETRNWFCTDPILQEMTLRVVLKRKGHLIDPDAPEGFTEHILNLLRKS